MNTPSEETKRYLCELKTFIDEALDDYIEARNALNQAKERIKNAIKELGYSESQARTLADGWCNEAYISSTRNDI